MLVVSVGRVGWYAREFGGFAGLPLDFLLIVGFVVLVTPGWVCWYVALCLCLCCFVSLLVVCWFLF